MTPSKDLVRIVTEHAASALSAYLTLQVVYASNDAEREQMRQVDRSVRKRMGTIARAIEEAVLSDPELNL